MALRSLAAAVRELTSSLQEFVAKPTARRSAGSGAPSGQAAAGVDRALAEGIRRGQNPELIEAIAAALASRMRR